MNSQTDIQPIENNEMDNTTDLTLVIPLLNEEESLKPLMQQIRDVLVDLRWLSHVRLMLLEVVPAPRACRAACKSTGAPAAAAAQAEPKPSGGWCRFPKRLVPTTTHPGGRFGNCNRFNFSRSDDG